jgi:hypothetical protein
MVALQPAVAVSGDTIYMLCSKRLTDELIMSQTDDGLNCAPGRDIGKLGTHVSLVGFEDKLVMTYLVSTDPEVSFHTSVYTPASSQWNQSVPLFPLETTKAAMTVLEGREYLVYSRKTDAKIFLSSCINGSNWQPATEIWAADRRSKIGPGIGVSLCAVPGRSKLALLYTPTDSLVELVSVAITTGIVF